MRLTLAAAALHLTHPLALLADPAPQLADQRLSLADGAQRSLRRPPIQRSAPPRPAATWPALRARVIPPAATMPELQLALDLTAAANDTLSAD